MRTYRRGTQFKGPGDLEESMSKLKAEGIGVSQGNHSRPPVVPKSGWTGVSWGPPGREPIHLPPPPLSRPLQVLWMLRTVL